MYFCTPHNTNRWGGVVLDEKSFTVSFPSPHPTSHLREPLAKSIQAAGKDGPQSIICANLQVL